jgi:hypothetical protein
MSMRHLLRDGGSRINGTRVQSDSPSHGQFVELGEQSGIILSVRKNHTDMPLPLELISMNHQLAQIAACPGPGR